MNNSKFERIVILQNPVSTDAHKADGIIKLLQRLSKESDFIIINTKAGGYEKNAKEIRNYAHLFSERTLLCIAGGDGTVNLALNFLLRDPALTEDARRTVLLPLWVGNANDLAYMLNGSPSSNSLRRTILQGRTITVNPLICRLNHDGSEKIFIASNYVSFGASGFAMRRLERSIRTKSPMRQFAVSRFGLEFVEVSRLLMRAPRFRIRENGREHIIYERVFLKGSRFAKIAAVPLKLTEQRFHRATVGHKSLITIMFSLAELMRDRAGRRVGATHDNFTVLDRVWAQFDGESHLVNAGTEIDISLSNRPFFALSTKLK